MTVEIISVGTELLLGNIVNTNAAFLAEQCSNLGLSCFYQTVVGDNEERLTECIETALGRSDIILFSGGLGPTEDDLTKEVVAKVMNCELKMDEGCKKHLKSYFAAKKMECCTNNYKQAMIPQGGQAILNDNGTAPGILLEVNGKILILLPGPPNELKPMFQKRVCPYLKSKQSEVIMSQTIKMCGVCESKVETELKDLIDAQTNPTIATYAKTGEVHVRVTAKEKDEKAAEKLLKPIVKEIKKRYSAEIYTTDLDVSLEQAVVDLLLANKLTISTFESCTGGLLAANLINISGVSDAYKSGFITYSNKSKRKLLGVKKTTLDKHGAVSEQVAREMVVGGASATKADIAVSITGIAGPNGGTKEKPVGLVYIGCNICGKVSIKEYHFSGDRMKIRESCVAAALCLLRQCLMEHFSKTQFGE